MYPRRLVVLVVLVGALLSGVLGGAAISGAATTQQVTASLSCVPSTVTPGTSTGCVLTVTNTGGNNVNNVTIKDTASSGAAFLSTSRPTPCTISEDKLVLTCSIGKLTAAGTAGATFSETHELEVPAQGASVSQTLEGRYSSTTGNNRGSDAIGVTSTNPLVTNLNASADFDARFSNEAGDSVQTDPISTGNPYSTGATLGATGFAVGLTVEEKAAGSNNPNCPSTGCFGAQVIDFTITPLGDSAFPTSFTLTIEVYVGPGIQATDLEVRHTTTIDNALITSIVPLCSSNTTDPSGDCILSRTVQPSTKIATIVVTGPGTGNGSWGVG